MGFIKDIPLLHGNNYQEWRRRLDLTFTLVEIEWIFNEPCPTEPVAPVRESGKSDEA